MSPSRITTPLILLTLAGGAALTGCGSSDSKSSSVSTASQRPTQATADRAVAIVKKSIDGNPRHPRKASDFMYQPLVKADSSLACVSGKAKPGKERFARFSDEWVHWNVDLRRGVITEPAPDSADQIAPGLCDDTFATLRMYDAVKLISDQAPSTRRLFKEDAASVATNYAAWRIDGQSICLTYFNEGAVDTSDGATLINTLELGRSVQDTSSLSATPDDPMAAIAGMSSLLIIGIPHLRAA